MNKKIIFLTSANNTIGFGHLNRVIILAKLFKKKKYKLFLFGVEKKFIKTKSLFFKIVKNSPINNKKFNFLLLNKYLDFKKSFFIIDTYEINSDIQKILYKNKIQWLQFDNLNRKNNNFYANFIVNSNPSVRKKDYISRLKHNKTKLLLGPKFNLLRDEFKKIKNNNNNKNIFISSGAGIKDFGMIEMVVKKLLEIIQKQKIIIVINKKNISYRKLINLSKLHKNLKIFSDTKNISILMSQAKLFIVSGGNTLIESLMFKGSKLVISTAKNQISQCKSWSNLKYINYLGHISKKKMILKKIDKYFRKSDFKLSKKITNSLFLNEKNKIFNEIKKNIKSYYVVLGGSFEQLPLIKYLKKNYKEYTILTFDKYKTHH